MSLKVTVFSGPRQIEVAGDDAEEVIRELSFWSALPETCPECGAGLVFWHRRPQGFKYSGLRCLGTPSHSITFHVHKAESGGGLYYVTTEKWEDWRPGRDDANPTREDRFNEPPADARAETLPWTAEQKREIWNLAKEKSFTEDQIRTFVLNVTGASAFENVTEAGGVKVLAALKSVR